MKRRTFLSFLLGWWALLLAGFTFYPRRKGVGSESEVEDLSDMTMTIDEYMSFPLWPNWTGSPNRLSDKDHLSWSEIYKLIIDSIGLYRMYSDAPDVARTEKWPAPLMKLTYTEGKPNFDVKFARLTYKC